MKSKTLWSAGLTFWVNEDDGWIDHLVALDRGPAEPGA